MSSKEPERADREERLHGLLERLMEERRRRAEPDIEKLAAENPDLLPDLRALWAVMVISEEAALATGTDDSREKDSGEEDGREGDKRSRKGKAHR